MDKSLDRTVTYINLHEGVFIPGVGDLGKVFPTNAGKTIESLKMGTEQVGVNISGTRQGLLFEVIVPWANVKQAVLAPNEQKNSSTNKAK